MKLIKTRIKHLDGGFTYKPLPLQYDIEGMVLVKWFLKLSVRVRYEVS